MGKRNLSSSGQKGRNLTQSSKLQQCRTFLTNSTFTTTWRTFLLAEEVWCRHINTDLVWLPFLSLFFSPPAVQEGQLKVCTVSS